MAEIVFGSAVIETDEDLTPNTIAAMRSAFTKLRADFPEVPDAALARDVFVNGQLTDDDDAIVGSARIIFGGFEPE